MADAETRAPARQGLGARALRWLGHEMRHALPPMIFFAAGFNLIAFSINLVLAQYALKLVSFMTATLAALLVGKVVLVAGKMRFLRRFDTAPLIRPILFKTAVYTFAVSVARIIEELVRYMIESGGMAGFGAAMLERFTWHHFVFVQLWVAVLFLIYVTFSELNMLFGDGELFRILFTHRSSALRLTRRQRIRTMVAVSRLLDAHAIDELRDPTHIAHRQLVGLIGEMARAPR
jgi:hypothetical protein